VEVKLQAFLISVLDGDKWSASLSGPFTPGERTAGTHWMGGYRFMLLNITLLDSRWKDNIEIYLKEIRREDVDWIHLAEDRVQLRALVNTVMSLRVPQEAERFLNC
jgi:hypothetical protein